MSLVLMKFMMKFGHFDEVSFEGFMNPQVDDALLWTANRNVIASEKRNWISF